MNLKSFAAILRLIVIFLIIILVLSPLTVTKEADASQNSSIASITSVSVDYINNMVHIYSVGRPFYNGYTFKRLNKDFFIVAFSRAILYAKAQKLTRPFGNVLNVAYAQFSTMPKDVVHVVLRERFLKKLPVKTYNLGSNRFDTVIFASGKIEKKAVILKRIKRKHIAYPRRKTHFNVFIDAGHVGNDPGGIGPEGLPESFVNLSIALNLEKLLNAKGIKTEIDRTSNVNVSLVRRVDEANRSGANLFIGLYCNSAIVPYLYGTTTYYFHKGSYNFSRYLENYVSRHLDLKNDGVVMDDLYVLRFTDMPAVLIEYAYISNPYEERLLASSTFRYLIASAIANAIYKYFIIDKK